MCDPLLVEFGSPLTDEGQDTLTIAAKPSILQTQGPDETDDQTPSYQYVYHHKSPRLVDRPVRTPD